MAEHRWGRQACSFPCILCRGLGWTKLISDVDAWPDVCALCDGIGYVKKSRLAKRLAGPNAKWDVREKWSARLRRVERHGVTDRTWRHIWAALVKHIPEVF